MATEKVLVLGTTGMLGNAVFRFLSRSPGFSVIGTARTSGAFRYLPEDLKGLVKVGVDVNNPDSLLELISDVRPTVVINCVGLIKQLAQADDPLEILPINSILPHRLAHLCKLADARLVHVSTDCVFSGRRGMYVESDVSDTEDLYGKSKYIGEVDYSHSVTLRTSIIGHELNSSNGLIGWFLNQEGQVKGYGSAIFSGLPTVELARVIKDYVIPNRSMQGLFHVSVEPISKFDLLRLVSDVYGKKIDINRDDQLVIDRSLDSTRFRKLTGYRPPAWPELIQQMKSFG
jgi:dTDP-4-dehydrorhamnose reductase